jgi:hypothetical protein
MREVKQMNADKITQQELIAMFGDSMPVEAWWLIGPTGEGKPVEEIRARLREIAAKKPRTVEEVFHHQVQAKGFSRSAGENLLALIDDAGLCLQFKTPQPAEG